VLITAWQAGQSGIILTALKSFKSQSIDNFPLAWEDEGRDGAESEQRLTRNIR
jgi:hypothetical protein